MITKTFKQSQFDKILRQEKERQFKLMRKYMISVGEACVQEGWQNHEYTDRTGNLSSSMGYVLLENGIIVKTGGFKQYFKSSEKTNEGTETGRSFAEFLATSFDDTKGFVLIVVAGMFYATYVEARGYNVISSAQIVAKRIMQGKFKRK